MTELIKSIFRSIGSKNFLILLALTLSFYIIIEKIGLFRLEPASFREIFHSAPAKILGIVLAVNALGGLVSVVLNQELKTRLPYVLFFLSIILLCAGLWTSTYTRFEGKTQVVEGESFTAFPTQYIQQTLYMREKSIIPRIGLTIREIHPELSQDKQELKRITANVLYSSKTSNKVLDGVLSSGWPLVTDWTLVRISDFGYTVNYRLLDLQERELEKRDVNMKLFPPGAEEFFDVMFLGYMFHVRLYPDYTDSHGKHGTVTAYPKNPLFILRIVRNKDIVYNDTLFTNEKLQFDNNVITLPGVKMWVEVSFVRDLGLPVAGVGVMLLLVSVVWIARKRK